MTFIAAKTVALSKGRRMPHLKSGEERKSIRPPLTFIMLGGYNITMEVLVFSLP